MLRLIKTSLDQKEQILDFLAEWHDQNEKIIPVAIDQDVSDFSAYVKQLRDAEIRENLKDGWVPSTTYWLTDGKEVLGAVNMRHELNEPLLNMGGHIGYGIKPSARGKGLATEQLRLALEKLKELDVERALITCDRTNPGSRHVIVKNGGEEDVPFTEEDGNIVERFWIDLKK